MNSSFIMGETKSVESLKYYEDNYDFIWIPCPEKLKYIETQKEYVCRFCGRDKTQTTFKKKAHAMQVSSQYFVGLAYLSNNNF